MSLALASAHAQDEFTAQFRRLREIVEQDWSYLELRRAQGLSLDVLDREAQAAIAASPDAATFGAALRRYVAALCDGHASVSVPGTEQPAERRLPLWLADAVEGVIVHGVHEPSVGGELNAGDVVVEIDDQPIEALIAEMEREVFASTAGARRKQALFRLATRWPAERARITLRGADGEERVVDATCPPATAVVDAGSLSLRQRAVRRIDESIGYFRPGNFSWPRDSGWFDAPPERRDDILADSYAELRAAIAELADVEVLVLDLRRNPGGTDLLGQELAGMLLPKGAIYFGLQSRGDDGTWRRRIARIPVRHDPDAPRYGGPLICLIDEGTFSVADNFAACVADEHPDVTFVGRPTGGGTGAPRRFELAPGGAEVRLCTMRVYSPDGELIEGRGTVPDVPVRYTRDDLRTGRDADLERALEIARARLR